MRKISIASLAAIGIVAASAASAATTVTAGTSEGSTTDPFNGATVTGSSAILDGFTAADAFGSKTSGGPYAESQAGGHVIFANAGDNFINFSTASAVTISGFNIYASSDGVGNNFRGFDSVSLYAMIAGVETLLGSASYDAGMGPVTITGTFAPITASDFTFTSTSPNGGPRVLEIDAVAAVPEPATWAMMMLGFGMVGVGLRSRKRAVRITYA